MDGNGKWKAISVPYFWHQRMFHQRVYTAQHTATLSKGMKWLIIILIYCIHMFLCRFFFSIGFFFFLIFRLMCLLCVSVTRCDLIFLGLILHPIFLCCCCCINYCVQQQAATTSGSCFLYIIHVPCGSRGDGFLPGQRPRWSRRR
jgi:hypothetical protein